MKKLLLLFLSFFTITFSSKSQDRSIYNEKFAEGNYLILEENYPQALKSFLQAYAIDSTNANINYKIGYCYIKTEAMKGKAAKYLEKAIKNTTKYYDEDAKDEKIAPVNAFYFYGLALHLNYKFDEAIANYLKFKSFLTPSKHAALIKDVDRMIEISKNAKQLVSTPVPFNISNLGDSINSAFPDYSSVLSADEKTIIFTSRRPGSTGGDLTFEGDYFEDIYVSHKKNDGTWESPKSISPFINSDEHEASVGLIADGQTLLIYKNTNGGDLFESHLEGTDWTTPMPLEGDINTSHWEPSACLTPDGNTIYFVSDRPGGFGGRDIWTCVKLPNGKWSKATNLGAPINTEYDEDSPFISADDILFFSSTGHNTMGGFDVFWSNKTEKGWSEPQNIGYPINTTDNDIYYTTSPDGKRGYFTSSLRAGGLGDKDIYMATAPEKKEESVVLIKGLVIPAEGDPLPSDIEIYALNNESGMNYVSKVLMRDGSFIFILPPNVKYTVSYQQNGQEFMTEEWGPYEAVYKEIKKEFHLMPGKKGEPISVDKGTVTNTNPINNKTDNAAKKDNTTKTVATENRTKTDAISANNKTDNVAKKDNTTKTVAAENGTKTDANSANNKTNNSTKKDNTTNNTTTVPTANTISADGVVFDINCKPYANKNINVINSKGDIVKTVTTNGKGGFMITKLVAEDEYTLKAQDPEIRFCNKSKITYRDKNNNVLSSKNFGEEMMVASKEKTDNNNPIKKADNKDNLGNNTTAVAADNTISADGIVYDINCKPYANKNINLVDSKGNIVKTVTTNGKGGFMITQLVAEDDYTLKAEDPEIRFCNKSKITYRDKKNKVINSKNFGEEKMVALKEKPINNNSTTKTNTEKTEPKSEIKHEQLAKVHHRKFEMYFKYNVFETDVADEPFKKLIDNILELYKENGKINFNITSCASQVPTRKFASNKELSIARADKMKEQLLSALKEKGIDASNITFVKVKSIVGGPTYNADYLTNKAVYEKFQFVKVSAF